MARTTKPLTDTQIKQAKPKDKDYKLSDGGGVYLLVTKRATKLWKMKYYFDGKEKLLSFGSYPKITLSKVRELRDSNKKLIANGINPNDLKKELQEKQQLKDAEKLNTFELIALERLEKVKEDISEHHYKRTINSFKNDVFPLIGNIHIDKITRLNIIEVLQVMMKRGIRTSTKQVYYAINRVFKYAISNGKATRNIAGDIELMDIIGKSKKNHYPTITDDEGIKNLFLAIDEYKGELSTKKALEMLAYTFVRPSNIRLALWEEIDLESKQWNIPAEKMKTKQAFMIPLSDKVILLLKDLREYSGDSPYLFPSTKSKTVPLSDGALLGAIRRMGYNTNEFTPHGFRAMFSTIAHDKSTFKHDVIEIQQAHSVGNSVSQAYNRAEYLKDRTDLMNWWSDYLDEIRKS